MAELQHSSFIQLLIGVAFENINNDIFDVLLTTAVEYLKACEGKIKVAQLLVQTVSLSMILNNLKTTNPTQVDRRVLFLQLIAELVRDRSEYM